MQRREDIEAALAEIVKQEAEEAKKREERELLKKNLLQQQQTILMQVGAVKKPSASSHRIAVDNSASDSDDSDNKISIPVSRPDTEIGYVVDDGEAPYEWNYGVRYYNPHDDAALRSASFEGDLERMTDLLDQGARIEAYDDSNYEGRVPDHFSEGNGDAIHNAIRGDQPEALHLLINRIASLLLRKLKATHEYEFNGKEQFGFLTAQALAPHIASISPFFTKLYWRLKDSNRILAKIPELATMFQRNNSLLIEAVKAQSKKCVDMLLNDFSKKTYSRIIYITPCVSSDHLERYQDGHTLIVSPKHNDQSMYLVYAKYNLNDKPLTLNSPTLNTIIEPLAQKTTSKPMFFNFGYQVAISYDQKIIDEVAKICESDHSNLNDLMRYMSLTGTNTLSNVQHGNALNIAVELGNIDIAKSLMAAGCSLEEHCDNYKDSTPLMMAIIKNDTAMATLLLENGADIHHCTRDQSSSKSALLLASSNEMRELLRGHLTLSDRVKMQNIVLPNKYLCPISHAILNAPIHYQGMTVDRDAYMSINMNKPDNKKVDPAGKPIDKQTYDNIIRSEVDETLLNEIKAYVREEEKHCANSQDHQPKKPGFSH